ncbi:MAG: hypothetical protein LPK07_16060, partial [Hymenobacteraceae bacterium]|nr:hypothetical protein [Hymenobacteraceae bacterium]
MHKHLLSEGITALLILLFFYTALSKLLDFQAFEGQLLLQPFPAWAMPYLLWGLPTVELVACWLLFRRGTRRPGLYLSTLLMGVFTGYVALVLSGAFGSIPCSCGGVLEQMGWMEHLVFNTFFLALAIVGTRLHLKAKRMASPGKDPQGHVGQKGG